MHHRAGKLGTNLTFTLVSFFFSFMPTFFLGNGHGNSQELAGEMSMTQIGCGWLCTDFVFYPNAQLLTVICDKEKTIVFVANIQENEKLGNRIQVSPRPKKKSRNQEWGRAALSKSSIGIHIWGANLGTLLFLESNSYVSVRV